MWGFREFEAYLLIVDGVPWGGAFNPQVATLILKDIERIEILRGAAPVMYGATSFIGVIQVIRNLPGQGETASGQPRARTAVARSPPRSTFRPGPHSPRA
jgi:outer membrane cobalamin receptor